MLGESSMLSAAQVLYLSTIQAPAFFVSWTFGLASVYQGSASSPTTQLIGAAYPVGDIVIIGVLLLSMRRATPQLRGIMALLLGGLAATAVADSSFSYLTASGVYTATGNLTDAGWVIGYLMVALAPFYPAPFAASFRYSPPAFQNTPCSQPSCHPRQWRNAGP